MKLPETPEEVRQFVMSDYCSLTFGRDDEKPCEEDVYEMTAHDLLSAFDNWKTLNETVPNA